MFSSLAFLPLAVAAPPQHTVLVVDVAQRPGRHTSEGLQRMVDVLVERGNQGVAGEEVTVITYAGDALVHAFAVDSAKVDTIAPTRVCDSSQEAWFEFYRYQDGSFWDPEIEDLERNYRYLDWDGSVSSYSLSASDPEDFLLSVVASINPWMVWPPATPVSAGIQCNAWDYSLLAFDFYDPRRAEALRIGYAGDPTSALSCDAGNWYDASLARFEPSALESLDCGYGATIPHTAILKFGGGGAPLAQDLSFAMAGSDPGVGLRHAADLIAAEGLWGAQVVLLADEPVPCGWTVRPADEAACMAHREQRLVDAVADLGSLQSSVTVFGAAPAGSTGEAILERVMSPWPGQPHGLWESFEAMEFDLAGKP